MAARFDITLTGATELQRMLGDMAPKLERKVLTQALRRTANEVKKDAMQRVPTRQVRLQEGLGKRAIKQRIRHAIKAARLRNSFTVKAMKRSRRRVGYTVWTGTRQQLGITSKYYYPAHLEWGHAGPGGSARRTAPRPYLRPSIKNPGLMATLIAEIAAGIERHAGDAPGSGGTLPNS